MQGLFVVITGIDGCGKSTVIERLPTFLENLPQEPTFLSRTNYVTDDHVLWEMAQSLRSVIWRKIEPEIVLALGKKCWIHLRMAWYELISNVFRDRLQTGELLIVDDWYYKLYARDLCDPGERTWLQQQVQELLQPDLVILIDVDPEVAAGRKMYFRPGETGVFRSNPACRRTAFISYQKLVADQLKDLGRLSGWQVVNGEGTREDVARSVAALIETMWQEPHGQ